ncbi:uncharacterized protein LOC121387675 [Gigantopelta aegis]|uniref:uncharacterized protein LOC121387675 n=1 Tax=Gigantopelta aegis TaxID=1735272 RepID=UPI001B88B22D|nr:uncharacterized protein LOC121387675 [Gigantopelta aegis]XP_041374799.1 uncharacterized protein LOC121387675 [Gigantopelta aegis]
MAPTATFFVCLLVLHVTYARPRDLQLISDRLTKNMRRAASYRMGYLFGKRSGAASPAETADLIKYLRPQAEDRWTHFYHDNAADTRHSSTKLRQLKGQEYLLI